MRSSRRWSAWLGAAAIATAVVAVVVAACFSERNGTAPTPSDGTCEVPLGTDVLGSTLVFIRDLSFQPAELRIRAGQKVTWVNCETTEVGHTTTADGGAWASQVLSPGQTFTYTFDAAGTFPYHCIPHPFMTAQVIVE